MYVLENVCFLTENKLKMKKVILFFCYALTVVSCDKSAAEKPKNLIEKDKMIDILYDISLLEAIKSQNINGGITSKAGSDYIYKKYKIDSLQFVKSNKFYASDIEEYKKMFEKVKEKLTIETNKIKGATTKKEQSVPSTSSSPPNQDVPQVQ
jgi:hypothetical protein